MCTRGVGSGESRRPVCDLAAARPVLLVPWSCGVGRAVDELADAVGVPGGRLDLGLAIA